ncbi:YkgJ family cysteine cluster protein [Foetidibacter luteolus]|uniref:YkgJ family cysteine cluster protein n=1 Tax=Foetidibacter luteolus TaxID=2608880 RepID=UPI00129B2D68|nr:YkgJ family cysteine cluster protein [Foetidibacter luteolus]
MQPVNMRSFKQKVRYHKKNFKRFLGKLEKNPPRNLDKLAVEVDKEVWGETDCLTCANCCKNMTPTFTNKDIKRIAAHLGMTKPAFTDKWLKQDKDKDWVNKTEPCQFLDLNTNMCSIYEVRPDDCAGFPHLRKKKMVEYIHVHQQNIEYCPATFNMVKRMMERLT